jgi:hypothetical protein
MRRALVVATSLCACGQLEPTDTGEAEPRAVLLGNVDIDTLCDIVGAREVIVRATRVGCEQPGPCTLPAEPVTRTGDLYSCPATASSALLGVDIDLAGQWAMEAIAITTTDDEEGHACFAVPGEAPPVLVTMADIDAGVQRMLEPTGAPCP